MVTRKNDGSTWRGRTRRAAGMGVAILSLLVARPAAADKTDDDALRAEELFKEARAAVEKNDYATACPKFEQSLALVRRAGTLFNLAQCEEHEGRLVSAMRYYKEGIVVLDPGDSRLAPSKKRLKALEPRIPYLTIKPKADLPKDSRVLIDGKQVEALGVPVPIDPGKRTISVQAPKRTEEKVVIEVAEKEEVEISVGAGKVIVEPTRAVADVLGPRRIAGIAALGVGGLGFIGAAITGGLVVSANSRVEAGCPQARCNTAAGYEAAELGKTMLVVNAIAWGVGIVGAGTGAVLFFLDGKKAKEKPKAGHSFLVGPGFVGVRGSF